MVIPLMFIAATPVDAASKAVGFQDSLEHAYRFLLQCGRLF